MSLILQVETMMMLHQLVKLLMLLLFVVNLPSCWSLCDISAARLSAHLGQYQKLEPCNELADDVAKRAAEQADVISPSVVEAYQVCSVGTLIIAALLETWCINNRQMWLRSDATTRSYFILDFTLL